MIAEKRPIAKAMRALLCNLSEEGDIGEGSGSLEDATASRIPRKKRTAERSILLRILGTRRCLFVVEQIRDEPKEPKAEYHRHKGKPCHPFEDGDKDKRSNTEDEDEFRRLGS